MEVGVFGVFGTPAELELALRGKIFRGAVIGAAIGPHSTRRHRSSVWLEATNAAVSIDTIV